MKAFCGSEGRQAKTPATRARASAMNDVISYICINIPEMPVMVSMFG